MNRVIVFILLVIFLVGCGPSGDVEQSADSGEEARPTEMDAVIPTHTPMISQSLTATLTASETPSITPSPTPTITPSPTVSPSPTITPTPSFTPIGGGYARVMIYDTQENSSYCGIMSLDGDLLEKRYHNYWDPSLPPLDCPDSGYSHDPKWSPNNQNFFYWYTLDRWDNQSDYELFVGTANSQAVESLGKFSGDQVTYDNFPGRDFTAPPLTKWVGNDVLMLLYRDNHALYIVDTQTSKKISLGSFPFEGQYSQLFEASYDGNYVALSTGGESDQQIEIIGTDSQETWQVISELPISYIYQIFWSPESNKFASMVVIDKNRQILLYDVSLREYELLDGERPLWSPDGSKFLYYCNNHEICVAGSDGEFLLSYSPKKVGFGDIEWRNDGNGIFFWRGNSYKTLHQVDFETGTEIQILGAPAAPYDREKTLSNSEKNSSPDQFFWFLNNAGSEHKLWFELGYSGNDSFTSALLCDVNGQCRDFSPSSRMVAYAQWWNPESSWQPQSIRPLTKIDEGEIVFEDSLTEIDQNLWETTGDINFISTQYGVGIQLDSSKSNPPASIKYRPPEPEQFVLGDAVRIDIQSTRDSIYKCGIAADTTTSDLSMNFSKNYFFANNSLWPTTDILITEGNTSYKHEFTLYDGFENMWLSLLFRVRDNNQLDMLIWDKTYNKVVKAVSIPMETVWTKELWEFSCRVNEGSLIIEQFQHLEFAVP